MHLLCILGVTLGRVYLLEVLLLLSVRLALLVLEVPKRTDLAVHVHLPVEIRVK